MRVIDIMLALIRYDVLGHELSGEVKENITPEVVTSIYKIAFKHDLAHLIADALEKNGLTMGDEDTAKRLTKLREIAVFRYAQIQYEQRKVFAAFEKCAVPFVPLKGAIMRQYYPAPWMRTSSDIDILIRHEDIQRATEVLERECGYKSEGSLTAHDISFHSTTGVHFELHYDLVEENDHLDMQVSSDVWSHTVLADGCSYHYLLTDEAFYHYHVIHMAKHFRGGGCGIRTLLDLWILNNRVSFDEQKRNKLIAKSSLTEYNEAMKKLSEVWFADAVADDFTKEVEAFVLTGGVYGTEFNHLAIKQAKAGGRIKYILGRLFAIDPKIKKKHPKLYCLIAPFYQMKRWIKLLFSKSSRQRIQKEVYSSSEVTATEDKTRDLLDKLNI